VDKKKLHPAGWIRLSVGVRHKIQVRGVEEGNQNHCD